MLRAFVTATASNTKLLVPTWDPAPRPLTKVAITGTVLTLSNLK